MWSSGGRPLPATRFSAAANTAVAGRLAARHTQAQGGHPAALPRVSGTTRSSALTDSRPAPARSSRASHRPSAGRNRNAAATAATPTGTFTRKTARQPRPATSADTSTPPRIWPLTAPDDSASAYRPMARTRSVPVKCSWIPVIACGNITPAPAPCRMRAATSTTGSGASPQAREARVNTETPATKARRQPYACPSRAPVISSIATAIRYPPTTSWSAAPDAPRPACTDGTATLTMVASACAMNGPISSTPSSKPG